MFVTINHFKAIQPVEYFFAECRDIVIRNLFQCNIVQHPATPQGIHLKWPQAAWRNCSQVAFIENFIAPLLLIATSAAYVATVESKGADMTGALIVCCFFSSISQVSRRSFLTWRLSTVSKYLARENNFLLNSKNFKIEQRTLKRKH